MNFFTITGLAIIFWLAVSFFLCQMVKDAKEVFPGIIIFTSLLILAFVPDGKRRKRGGWKIVSNMLDNPYENGIYRTSKCYKELYDFVVAQKEKARQEAIKEAVKVVKFHSTGMDTGRFPSRTRPIKEVCEHIILAIEKLLK